MNTKTKAVLALLITPFSMMYHGYALSILWRWFVVPTFGIPALSIPAAIGLGLTIAYLTHQNIQEDESRPIEQAFALAVIKPTFALFIGWLVQFFM